MGAAARQCSAACSYARRQLRNLAAGAGVALIGPVSRPDGRLVLTFSLPLATCRLVLRCRRVDPDKRLFPIAPTVGRADP